MPYQVQQIIEGKGVPVCVKKDDPISLALALMVEHDFSQLPVTKKIEKFDVPEGMITYEGILRGIRNFKAKIEDLKVRDVMISAPIYSLEDDLFDILDRLKETNAVLITENIGPIPDLVGIVTSYDTTEYFRDRTEDLMRVEDIELMVKDFIKAAHLDENGEINKTKLNNAVSQITAYKKSQVQAEKKFSFDDLSLGDYISLLLYKDVWKIIEPIFGVQKSFVNELLQGVREIRNALAHFRSNISAEQRDRLKFGAEWLSKRQEEYQIWKQESFEKKLIESVRLDHPSIAEPRSNFGSSIIDPSSDQLRLSSTDYSVTESAISGGRYAALADWLQSQPGRIDQVPLTFNKIEEIINADLPASARNHRAWWANDSVGHSHSQLWLDAGWRTTYINLSEGKVTFSRIREKEKAYITFYSKLLDELRKKADFPIRDVSPDGASWIVIETIPRGEASNGSFNFSFSRDKRLRVELYLDLADQDQTKAVFDKLFRQKDEIELKVGEIKWERLDNRRASRIAMYHDGHISDEKKHPELRKWAAESMVKFHKVMIEPVEQAIRKVKSR